MTTASFVPPTRDLDLDDVRAALAREPLGRMLSNAFLRFRYADGFSYARSMAFQVVLALIPGVILAVAVAVRLGEGRYQNLLRETITSLTPGPAGDVFLRAFGQGAAAVGRGNLLAIVLGGAAAIISGAAGMAQFQRGASRIYGILADRPTIRRYALATALTLTVGVLFAAAFVLIVLGSSAAGGLQSDLAQAWVWARWPLGIVLLVVALAALFKVAPNRPQPGIGWLALGGGVAGLGWLLVSVGLAVYLNASRIFGETYGPLAGFMGIMLWAFLSAIVIFYGLAVAAQLEARRSGVSEPVIEAEQAMPKRVDPLESRSDS